MFNISLILYFEINGFIIFLFEFILSIKNILIKLLFILLKYLMNIKYKFF